MLRLDGGLDGEVLRLLTHQDCGSGHRKDNSKDDRRRDPEQAFRLGDFGAWSNRALHLRLRSGRQAGAVELRRHFGRFGPLPRFIVTACETGGASNAVPSSVLFGRTALAGSSAVNPGKPSSLPSFAPTGGAVRPVFDTKEGWLAIAAASWDRAGEATGGAAAAGLPATGVGACCGLPDGWVFPCVGSGGRCVAP